MGIGKDGAVRRQLRTLFNVGAVRELTDGQLLERFATDRGEAAELAFAVLVERHGPMVMRVCRGVLADPHDAAGRLPGHVPGPGEAGPRALGARLARPLAAPGRLPDRVVRPGHRRPPPTPGTARGDVRGGGPPRVATSSWSGCCTRRSTGSPIAYRSPVVLCDLEGRTYEQAARHLGWPVGTVKSRLSRGRERLRDRLIRRGRRARTLGPLAVVAGVQGPRRVRPPCPAGCHDNRRRAIRRDRPGGARVGRDTRRGSPPNHDDDAMVEGRHGPGGRRRDGLGGGMGRSGSGPGAQVPAARRRTRRRPPAMRRPGR